MGRPLAILLALALGISAASPANATHPTKRSVSAKTVFKHQHPCPATGLAKGRCPGYVIDHVVPLCAGGTDDPSNMQWQTVADSRAKDLMERRQCAAVATR